MARSSIELTEETQQKICDAIRVGASLKHAAQYAGVSERTLYRWIKLGRSKEDPLYIEFWKEIKKARAEQVIVLLIKINQAASKHWKAAAWKLERLYPSVYGKSEIAKSRAKEDQNKIEGRNHEA